MSVTCGRTVFFSPGATVSSTNKINRHDIAEILLKVVLNTMTLGTRPFIDNNDGLCGTER
jgi:hypothetical protein